MKIREFLAMFEGRDPESELKGIVLPFAHDLTVVGVANRGEFAELLSDKASDEGDDEPPGQRWDDTYVILDDESIKEVTGH